MGSRYAPSPTRLESITSSSATTSDRSATCGTLHSTRVSKIFVSVAADTSDPREQFRICVKTIVEFTLASPEIPCIHYHEALINRSAKKNSDRYQRILEHQVARYRALIEGLVTQAQEAGIIEQIPFDDFCFVFQGAILHRIIVSKESEHFSGMPIEEIVDAHTDAIVRSFTK